MKTPNRWWYWPAVPLMWIMAALFLAAVDEYFCVDDLGDVWIVTVNIVVHKGMGQ